MLGNAAAQISKLRRKEVLRELNPDIVDLAEEDTNFQGSTLKLCGPGFEDIIKKQAEAIKLLASEEAVFFFFLPHLPLSPSEVVGSNQEEGGATSLTSTEEEAFTS